MKVVVDRDLCQGHAECVVEAPDVFRLGPGDQVEVLAAQPPDALHDAVRAAVRYCPTHALRIEED
jgi:ferredoxin